MANSESQKVGKLGRKSYPSRGGGGGWSRGLVRSSGRRQRWWDRLAASRSDVNAAGAGSQAGGWACSGWPAGTSSGRAGAGREGGWLGGHWTGRQASAARWGQRSARRVKRTAWLGQRAPASAAGPIPSAARALSLRRAVLFPSAARTLSLRRAVPFNSAARAFFLCRASQLLLRCQSGSDKRSYVTWKFNHISLHQQDSRDLAVVSSALKM